MRRCLWHNLGRQERSTHHGCEKFERDITEDRNVIVPADVPLGRAEIVITPQEPSDSEWGSLKQLIIEMSEGPFHKRSKEDIDAYICHERESWE